MSIFIGFIYLGAAFEVFFLLFFAVESNSKNFFYFFIG